MTDLDTLPLTTATRTPRLPGIATWQTHRDILGNAGSLVASAVATSALGLVYWAVAARTFTQQSVGYGSAAISAMTLLGTVGMLGLGTVLIGELPRRTGPRGGLIVAALLVSGVGSLLLGVGFAVLAPLVSHRFVHVTGSPGAAVLFAIGVALTGATLVFDQATIGLLRGGLQLWRNVAFSAVKVATLVAAAVLAHDAFGVGITASWVSGIVLSLVPLAWLLKRGSTRIRHNPDWAVLRRLGRTTLAHNWLNLAIQGPRLLIPVLVTAVVSAAANGAFYIAWMLVGFLYIVPTHLSTALFAVASGQPDAMARKVRFTLRLSAALGAAGMAVLGFGAHPVLSVFGARYAAVATVPLELLVLGYVPTVAKVHFIAVCRASDRIPRAAAVLSASAVVEITAAAAGARVGGLTGLCGALLACFVLEGVVTAPAVWRAAWPRRGHHRRAG